jgi:hypothetical protein
MFHEQRICCDGEESPSVSTPPSLRAFLLEHFLDADARVPAVIGRDAADVITPDRTLRDAALALVVLPGPDDGDLTARLLRALRKFTDPEHPGHHELLDATGAVHPVGDVRTPSWQALAAWALHRAGTLLSDAALTAEAREQLHRVTDAVLAHGWPARLDRSWSTVLDGASPLEETAFLILAADAVTPDDPAFLGEAARHLERYVHGDGVLVRHLPGGGRADRARTAPAARRADGSLAAGPADPGRRLPLPGRRGGELRRLLPRHRGALHAGRPSRRHRCLRALDRGPAERRRRLLPDARRAIGTTDEGFIAVQALHMLEGKLNRSWAVMMT